MKIAIIGTYIPRRCGIATFTHDLFQSLQHIHKCTPAIVAVSDGSEMSFPDEVKLIIERDNIASYRDAASYINADFDVCVLQHEYGIFGGKSGDYILELTRQLNIPVIANLHTVLKSPSVDEKNVLQRLALKCEKVTVMTPFAIQILTDTFGIKSDRIAHIPHGVPVFDFDQKSAKKKVGLSGKKVMLSFGFLGPSKGYETAIEAVAKVKDDDFVYVILGTTHPNIVREHGEIYREHLEQKVAELDIVDKVKFVNYFATEKLLVEYLSACDIYVTPYPSENQISSGTLSFALGAGAAVLSTPYWYAKDLLADNRGLLFDFKDPVGLSALINQLLDDPEMLQRYRCNAASHGKKLTWANVGKMHWTLFNEIISNQEVKNPLGSVVSDLQENFNHFLLKPAKNKLSF